MEDRRTLRELSRSDALRLLASVAVGRVVFTQRALPAIRPVNHVVTDGLVVFGTHDDSSVSTEVGRARGIVIAYEADEIDVASRTGWSVVVTGFATRVGESALADRYRELLHPWVGTPNHVITLQPRLVTGFRLVPGLPPATLSAPGPTS
ncbi:pyridoxamine 5'-phosphate oxidase family protein [Micromonospora citrea]|uniref:pyridoxamine 5'-phosphate oxidase family protein n=1 Tax=Micromonospora citrea TaxID=47855 RepID=UPI003C62572A